MKNDVPKMATIKYKEASSHDKINMTELGLEYDQKIYTMMNVNIGTWPKILTTTNIIYWTWPNLY